MITHCGICNNRMFQIDPENRHLVKIKHRGTKEHILNIEGMGQNMKECSKPIKRDGHFLFEVMEGSHSVIRIMCEYCKSFHMINLSKGQALLISTRSSVIK